MEAAELLRIGDDMKSLAAQVDELKGALKTRIRSSRSEQLNELFAALAKAQAEMQIAGLSSENPYFKSRYADFAAVVRASRPYLTKYGLSVLQQVSTTSEGYHLLHTVLGHASGQWIESQIRIVPIKNDMQSLGSMLTYLRRYSYAALVGVVASDEDDDGERAMTTNRSVATRSTGG